MEVFCSQCKYCKTSHRPVNIWEDKILCGKHPISNGNFYRKNIIYKDCKDINVINNCKDFEPKLLYRIRNIFCKKKMDN